jgi:hypothetical protein
MVKGKPQTFAIKAGDAQTGALTTMYEGARPNPSSPATPTVPADSRKAP